MTVSASATSVPPGATILFRIFASAGSWEAGQITTALTTSSKAPAFSAPEFTIAGCSCHLASASYGLTLPAGQPSGPQIEARVSVPATAPAGETIQFSATVSVANGSGSRLTATGGARAVIVAAAPASPSPAPSPKSTAASPARGSTSGGSSPGGSSPGGSSSGGSAPDGSSSGGSAPGNLGGVAFSPLGTGSAVGAALPGGVGPVAIPIGALPIIGSSASGSTINVPAGSAANLFPQITPSSAPSHAPKTGSGAQPGQAAVAVAATSPISLTGTQLESQVIGLIVLLLGVAVVATGISVRKVQAAGKPST